MTTLVQNQGGAVVIQQGQGTVVPLPKPAAKTIQVVTEGPRGPAGPPGQDAHMIGPRGKDGQVRFTGHGPPGVIVGAEPGDTYMDLGSGDIYKLT